MPLSARMSLWGMYQYDNSILDDLTLPDGMNADTVKDNLLISTAGMSILYPDIGFLKKAIKVWADERIDVWQRLYDTTQLEYDPIENYDRKEESSSSSMAGSRGSTTTTGAQTAYDSDEMADTGRTISEGDNQSNSSGSFHSRIHGNIGVTSSQQLIKSERDISEFCMTEYIINDFIQRFCIMVY